MRDKVQVQKFKLESQNREMLKAACRMGAPMRGNRQVPISEAGKPGGASRSDRKPCHLITHQEAVCFLCWIETVFLLRTKTSIVPFLSLRILSQ
jgi:hypothetical protein